MSNPATQSTMNATSAAQAAPVALTIAITMLVVIGMRAFTSGISGPMLLLMLSTSAAALWVWSRARQQRAFRVQGFVLFIMLVLSYTFGLLNSAGLASPGVVTGVVLPLVALVFMGVGNGIGVLLMLVVVYAGLMALHLTEYPFPGHGYTPERFLIVESVYLLMTAMLASLLTWFDHYRGAMAAAHADRRAQYDFLTSLLNLEGFERALQRYAGSQQQLSILSIDVDRFKQYNDTLGHVAGDDCLRKIAEVIANCVREFGDVSGRVGGDEFGVLLPGSNHKQAQAVAERIRSSVHALGLVTGEKPPQAVTLTVGVATFPENHRQSTVEMRRAADAAMYQGKRKGRNCVCAAGERGAG